MPVVLPGGCARQYGVEGREQPGAAAQQWDAAPRSVQQAWGVSVASPRLAVPARLPEREPTATVKQEKVMADQTQASGLQFPAAR
jgi:hypothetical protein